MEKLHQKLFWLLVLLLPTQLGRHFWPEWSYVLGLKIDYLSPTVYLTDLLVVGILGFWLWEIRNTRYVIRNTLRCHWWIIAIFVYLLVNSLLAQNPGAALYMLAKIIEFSLLGLYVAKNRYQQSTINNQLSLAIIYSSLIAIAQFIKQASLNGIFWWLGERTFTDATPGIAKTIIGGRLIMRPYATFSHPNVLAGFVLASLILIGVRSQESGVKKASQWLAKGLGIVTIAISFSRSAWLVGLVVGLWAILRHLRGETKKPDSNLRFKTENLETDSNVGDRSKKTRGVHLGGGGILLILLIFGFFLYFAPKFSTEEAISQRLQLTKAAISMIRISPVSGVGLNNFIVRLPEFWQTPETIRFLQPVHNIFFLVAAETGLVGLVIFLWFLILTYKRLLITNNVQLLLLLFVILILGLLDHYWLTLQQTQLLFAVALGLSWAKH